MRTPFTTYQNSKELGDRLHTARSPYTTISTDELATQAEQELRSSTRSKRKRIDDQVEQAKKWKKGQAKEKGEGIKEKKWINIPLYTMDYKDILTSMQRPLLPDDDTEAKREA